MYKSEFDKSELDEIRSKKENRTLVTLLFIGFVGSACLHAAAMITPIPALWKPVSKEDDTMEVVVDTTKTPAEKAAEVAKEPEPIAPNPIVKIESNQPVDAAPPAIALAPETTTPLNEGKDAAAPDIFKPLLTTGVSDTKIQQGGGSIIAKDGIGSGFGNAKNPTGFVLGGKINGNPNGTRNGVVGGVVNGKINGPGTQPLLNTALSIPTPTPQTENRTPKLECLSCPKPQYRGKEGTPRVTYDIAPDGTVSNVRLRQSSGDAQTDRETIEAMSKWQFNPKTIPEGGRTDVKVRVTFEEDGSKFQRENEERRRRDSEQLAEQQKVAEQERQQREAARSQSIPTAITPPSNSTPERSPVTTPVAPSDVNTLPAPIVTPSTVTPSNVAPQPELVTAPIVNTAPPAQLPVAAPDIAPPPPAMIPSSEPAAAPVITAPVQPSRP